MYIKYEFVTGEKIYIEVDENIFKYHIQNYWQEDWRDKKSDNEPSLEELFKNNMFTKELQENSSEDIYIEELLYDKLYEAIEQLPESQKRRIILRFFDNFSLQEIADIENCDLSSVKTLIHRATAYEIHLTPMTLKA